MPDAVSIVIADSSRLGTHMLEKILAPVADVSVCRTEEDLRTALGAGPHLCLVSYLWPGIEELFTDLHAHRPDTSIILLASPDSSPEKIARLCDEFDAGLVYRPFEPSQVIHEVMLLLSRRSDDTQAAAQNTLSVSDITGTELVLRDLAFCRRHHLSYSLLAIRIDGYALLSRELGDKVFRDLDWVLMDALSGRLRREDSICFQKPGAILLSLPGTPALGARVLAWRLKRWLGEDGIAVHGFQVILNITAGIHFIPPTGPLLVPEQIQNVMDMALMAAERGSASDEERSVQLTASAQAACTDPHHDDDQTQESAPDEEALWDSLTAMLSAEQQPGSSPRDVVLQRMARVLSALEENERMALVDKLLMASTSAY